jgi:hypothetical protein
MVRRDPKARKAIKDLAYEMSDWFTNMDRGSDYIVLIQTILSSLPGGDELEGLGDTQPIRDMGWHEFDLLGRMIDTIQDKRDVEDFIQLVFFPPE